MKKNTETENLMIDDDLKIFIKDLNGRFSQKYSQKDWKIFKKNADKFFDFFRETFPGSIPLEKLGFRKHIAERLKSRIFLGIGVELLLKSVYLKNGYLINETQFPKGTRKPNKPYKISEVKENYINKNQTYGIGYYLKNLHIFFEKCKHYDSKRYITYVKKGLSIVKIWRDKDTHIGGGYHMQRGSDLIDIQNSLGNIYGNEFNETFRLFKKRKMTLKEFFRKVIEIWPYSSLLVVLSIFEIMFGVGIFNQITSENISFWKLVIFGILFIIIGYFIGVVKGKVFPKK